MKERQEERNIDEIEQMREAAGGTKRLNRVDWMYTGASAGPNGVTEEMEGYLLGKRRIDGLIKGTENKKLEKGATEESFMALQNANTVRDTASKIREDPMLAIKKQEQAAYESLMNDPVRRRLLLKAAGQDAPSKDKERTRHRHHHHHHHDRDDRHRSHKRRHTNDEDRLKRRIRSPSPYDRRRSPSPYRHSRSPSRHDRTAYSQRSPGSPRRSRSPRGECANGHGLSHSRSVPSYRPKTRHNSSSPDSRSPPPKSRQPLTTGEKAARLAAMNSDANELDTVRSNRLAALEEREMADRKSEQEARDRSARYGGRGDFVHGLNRKAGEMDIGERMKRGRGGLERGLDDD